MRMMNSNGKVHTSLVMSKTKVAPIKRLSIPRLERCGAQVLTQLLRHAKDVFQLPMNSIFAWTDSTIVLNWLTGNPRRLKTFVGNRVSCIVDRIPPEQWSHVSDLKILLTAPREACCQLNSLNTAYGGVDPLGYDLHLVTGLRNPISLQIWFLRKSARYLL